MSTSRVYVPSKYTHDFYIRSISVASFTLAHLQETLESFKNNQALRNAMLLSQPQARLAWGELATAWPMALTTEDFRRVPD